MTSANEDSPLHAEYYISNNELKVTDQMKLDFEQYGYIIVRGLLDEDEVSKVKKVFENTESTDVLESNKMRVSDGLGRTAKLTVWSHPGDDVTGMVSRSEKVAGTCQQYYFIGTEYAFSEDFKITPKIKRDFDEYGYILVRGLLDQEEVSAVKKVFEASESLELIAKNKVIIDDGSERQAKLTVWSHPGDDVTGMVSRSEKVAGTCEALLGDEVYHYHAKLVTKEENTGGAFLWHQDYGYWYKNGCLSPDMMTVFIAIDKCTKENGCLEIIEGSNKCGRLDHQMVYGQTAIPDNERIEKILERFPLKKCLMNPGDALFFHCNVMHRSGQNSSPNRRWAFLTAFNTKRNNPVLEHHHPQYTQLQKVPNSPIKECKQFTMNKEQKDFLDPVNSKTVRSSVTLSNQ